MFSSNEGQRSRDEQEPSRPRGWVPWLGIMLALAMLVSGIAVLTAGSTEGAKPIAAPRFTPTRIAQIASAQPSSPILAPDAIVPQQPTTPAAITFGPTTLTPTHTSVPPEQATGATTLAQAHTATTSAASPTPQATSAATYTSERTATPRAVIYTTPTSDSISKPTATPPLPGGVTIIVPASTPVSVTTEAWLTSTVVPTATATRETFTVLFESAFYRPVDLERAAHEQWGASATLVSTCEHLHCWKARVGRELKWLDLKRAATAQYGPGWIAAAVGAGKNDWRAVKMDDLSYLVLPVMLVASDRTVDGVGIASGLARYRSVLASTQYWYYTHVGRTFRLLEPLVVFTDYSSAEWNALAGGTADAQKAKTLGTEAMAQYSRWLPAPPRSLRVIVAPYTGESAHAWQGAVAIGDFAVAPPRATSLTCSLFTQRSRECNNNVYSIGQALGYLFGLNNSCADYPGDIRCRSSLMQGAPPPGAILLQGEINKLRQSPFFTRYR